MPPKGGANALDMKCDKHDKEMASCGFLSFGCCSRNKGAHTSAFEETRKIEGFETREVAFGLVNNNFRVSLAIPINKGLEGH